MRITIKSDSSCYFHDIAYACYQGIINADSFIEDMRKYGISVPKDQVCQSAMHFICPDAKSLAECLGYCAIVRLDWAKSTTIPQATLPYPAKSVLRRRDNKASRDLRTILWTAA